MSANDEDDGIDFCARKERLRAVRRRDIPNLREPGIS